MKVSLVLLLGVQAGIHACDPSHADKIHSLPGLNAPLPSPWYSGYLDYELDGQQVHTHYVLIEAEDNDNNEKPLIYWSNGGPGASSLFGLLTELGPLLLNNLSLNTEDYKKTSIPTPIYNPYSWTRLGSLLIIDQPAPVGFSYCNNDTESHSCGGLAWTDELSSQNAYLALQTFYEKHSCLKEKELYLTGESYAGIYIPTLARRIFEEKENAFINLKGFAVGDGCLGTETGICGEISDPDFVDFWKILFLAGHGQLPLSAFQDLMRVCHHHFLENEKDLNHANIIDVERVDKACQEQVEKIHSEVGGFYEYSLFDECTYSNGLFLGGALNDYPCGGGVVMESYLKLQAVKDAFHVKSTFFEVDNAAGDFDYTATEPDLTGFYKQVNGKLKVLVYNGDTDPAITSFAAQNWTSHLGFEEVEEWRPWTVDSCQRVGGHVVRYRGKFDFLTIRGAGHMVPAYKPAATFSFLKAWIEGTEYPVFDEKCKHPLSGAVQEIEMVEEGKDAWSMTRALR
jgi:serine carboxypeptidase-like clade 1